jgi:hypothetical protein
MMVDVIARLYATEQQANDAVSKLKAAGFANDSVARVGPPPKATEEGAPEPAAPEPANALERELAATHGAELPDGRWLVAVAAPFGRGVLATSILEGAGALDEPLPRVAGRTGVANRDAAADSWGPAAPLSRLLGMPLLSNEAAPLSAKFGWPMKSKREYYFVSELQREGAPLSKALGLPTKTERRHFLTSGLSSEAAPLSSKLGIRTLSDEPAPLSAKFGWSLLKNNPTPLSSMLGLKVLSDNQ